VDFGKQQRVHPVIHIDGIAVEKVESVKFLGVHITDKLKWYTHTYSVMKKVQQLLFNLRKLKKFGLSPKTLTNFYLCTAHNHRANYLPSRAPSAPDVTGRPNRSSRTTTTRATACSPRYHPEGEASTGASKLGPRD
jgi:hypothetical protein